jgi:hypothetical protein
MRLCASSPRASKILNCDMSKEDRALTYYDDIIGFGWWHVFFGCSKTAKSTARVGAPSFAIASYLFTPGFNAEISKREQRCKVVR